MQLDLFQEPLTELDLLKTQLEALNECVHKVRKGLFRRSSLVEKGYLELLSRVDKLECEKMHIEKENRHLREKLAHIDDLVLSLSNYVASMESIA